MRLRNPALLLVLTAIAGSAIWACQPTPPPATQAAGNVPSGGNAPAAADVPLAAKTVWAGTYNRDIQPIFDQYCVSCHSATRAENGLRLDNYDNVMKGTQNGAVVTPGSEATSTLAAVIQGTADPKIRMPHQERGLTRNRIQNILLWIDAGAPKG